MGCDIGHVTYAQHQAWHTIKLLNPSLRAPGWQEVLSFPSQLFSVQLMPLKE